jgi:hypothetical protein
LIVYLSVNVYLDELEEWDLAERKLIKHKYLPTLNALKYRMDDKTLVVTNGDRSLKRWKRREQLATSGVLENEFDFNLPFS